MFYAQVASGGAINLTAIIVAGIGTLGAILSYIQASQVRREQRRSSSREVEAEAYQRARQFDMETVDSIRQEAERLRGLLIEEQAANRELRTQITRLDEIEASLHDVRLELESEKGTSDKLREQVIRLEERIHIIRENLMAFMDGRASEVVIQEMIDDTDTLLEEGGR